MNFDYIPLDQKVIEENVKEFERSRKAVISKVSFDNGGFENSVITLHFMNELLLWNDSNVDVRHVAFNVAYNYLEGTISNINMIDDRFEEILTIVNRWSRAFKCAYEHSSTVNFSWAFSELMKEVKPLIERWSIDDDE